MNTFFKVPSHHVSIHILSSSRQYSFMCDGYHIYIFIGSVRMNDWWGSDSNPKHLISNPAIAVKLNFLISPSYNQHGRYSQARRSR